MRRFLITAALLAATATTALGAHVASGYWTVYDTNGSGENAPLCGMRTSYEDIAASIYIKYVLGQKNLTVQVFKQGWRFPEKPINLPITLGFDNGTFGSTIAVGGNLPKAGPMVEFDIASAAIGRFLTAFSGASWMWIKFDEGTEKPWPAKMVGSSHATELFKRCVRGLIAKHSTQPFADKPSTQPFKGEPSPQPFGSAKPATVDDGGI